MVAVCVVARLTGLAWSTVGIVAAAEFVAVVAWVGLEARATTPRRASAALVLIVAALTAAFAASGAISEVGGDLETWFANLPVEHSKGSAGPDQALVALAAGVFLLATANRIVRLVLMIAQTQTVKAESKLKGGRLIGPMERLFIGAMLIAGEPGGIAIVIAAKGLLRLPEIQKSDGEAVDDLTEYFLIGTLASLLVALACGGAVLAVA